mmetsp:Transcript_19999/g.18990  ORF Transcript_19999/g.18990 Transcript_19999/m.18990 type:complete len:80 (-) Transcript_19999:45-284(-)
MFNGIFRSEVVGFAFGVAQLVSTMVSALINFSIGLLVTHFDGDNHPEVIGYVFGGTVLIFVLLSTPFYYVTAILYAPYA